MSADPDIFIFHGDGADNGMAQAIIGCPRRPAINVSFVSVDPAIGTEPYIIHVNGDPEYSISFESIPLPESAPGSSAEIILTYAIISPKPYAISIRGDSVDIIRTETIFLGVVAPFAGASLESGNPAVSGDPDVAIVCRYAANVIAYEYPLSALRFPDLFQFFDIDGSDWFAAGVNREGDKGYNQTGSPQAFQYSHDGIPHSLKEHLRRGAAHDKTPLQRASSAKTAFISAVSRRRMTQTLDLLCREPPSGHLFTEGPEYYPRLKCSSGLRCMFSGRAG